jgi:DNA-binding PadR family transcriptional regulator
MSRQESFQGSLPLLVLKILARRGPLHGYGITVRIEEISEEVLRVEEGSLYPALHRMEEAGWIKAKWVTTQNKRRPESTKSRCKDESTWKPKSGDGRP